MFRTKKKFKWDKGKPEDLFILEECLGEGTYGTVWTGTEKSTQRTCAVKVVMIDDDLDEIKQEIDIMRDSKSPYIVKFYGCYWGTKKLREEQKIWMIMEHCVAGSINDLMYVCDTVLNKAQIQSAVAGICLGLAYLHDNLYVIHRDIKAGNVLLTHDGYVRLADFGVSARLNGPSGRTSTAIGAPFWMAPEVIEEKQYTCNADVWSMGITAIELAESRPPLSDINPMQALFEIPKRDPPTMQKPKKWPDSMNNFIKVCLNKEPKSRPTSRKMLSHDFIAKVVQKIEKAGGKSVIMEKLVASSLKQIEAARRGSDDNSEYGEDSEEEEEEVQIEEIKTITKPETLPSSHVKSVQPQSLSAVPKTPNAVNSVRMSHGPMASQRGSLHLNPLTDRIPSGRYKAPLRDTFKPNSHASMSFSKGAQKNVGVETVAGIVTKQQEGEQVMAGIMNPEFIRMLKTIHSSDPDAFGGKPPSEWTSLDITKAVTGAMISLLNQGLNKNLDPDTSRKSAALDFGDISDEVVGEYDQFIDEEDAFYGDDDDLPPLPKSRESATFDDLDI